MSTTFNHLGNVYGWQSTAFTVAVGYTLRVRTSGYITASTGKTGFAEGSYGDLSTSHSVRPQDRVTWQQFPVSGGTFPCINSDVPLGLVIGIKAASGSAPTFNHTRGLRVFEGDDRDVIFTQNELYRAAGNLPGPYTVYSAFNDFQANSALEQIVLTLDAELDGLGGTHEDRAWMFKYDRAIDDQDRRDGGFCQETGFWAPGHRLVVDDEGRRVIDEFENGK